MIFPEKLPTSVDEILLELAVVFFAVCQVEGAGALLVVVVEHAFVFTD